MTWVMRRAAVPRSSPAMAFMASFGACSSYFRMRAAVEGNSARL